MAAQKREVFHLLWEKDHWTIKKARSSSRTGKFQNKEEALKKGRRIARSKRLGRLVVHKKNGRIQTEFTYGQDPRSRKG